MNLAKLSQEAVEKALDRLDGSLPGPFKSMWLRVWLVAKRIQALGHKPSISHVNEVVRNYFVIQGGGREGVINPFMESDRQLYWGTIPSDGKVGRTNVWDYATRTGKARVLFEANHMGSGLLPNSVDVLTTNIGGDKTSCTSLAVFLLRDQELNDGLSASDLVDLVKTEFGITDEELSRICNEESWDFSLFEGTPFRSDQLPPNRLPPTESSAFSTAAFMALPQVEGDIHLADDVWRMLRRALAKYRALMLVGPPGTGKTQLVRQLHREASTDPSAFGLSKPPGELMIRTLDDSWTSLDLVGGRSIVNNALRFIPGALLQAIREDRWLLLDEINRADVDRIFGALLTWLSGEETGVGRLLEDSTAPEVRLGWSHIPDNRCEPEDSPAEIVRYLAGNDFRLLGTYNAQDAHRVFRFGDALGRRFVRIPISEPTPYAFSEIIKLRYASLPEETKDILSKLYAAHATPDPTTILGPAIFLQMAEYLRPSEGEVEQPTWMREAYLINAGPFVMRFGYALEELKKRILESGALSEVDWNWITKNGRHLI
ncbi:MAG: hypothetical protein EOO38_02555 [Cytophagaceae bacterium]|nr:MAG: hypothetical protein EOO38_02555 [Cytophagaceae bacterium]